MRIFIYKPQNLFVVLVALFIITGCSSNNESTSSDQQEQTESSFINASSDEASETPNVYEPGTEVILRPETQEELVQTKAGRFAGVAFSENKKEITEILDQYPSVTERSSEKTIDMLKQLVLLFAEDYEDPFTDWQEITVEFPSIYNGKSQLKPKLNVEIILDASGSMVETVDGESKMSLAKAAIKKFTSNLPEEARVGLRVYGHQGTTAFEDKMTSCESSELVYEFQPYNESALAGALEGFSPAGWTPMAKALKDSMDDLEGLDSKVNTNLIFLVSDGIETCDGDPVSVANELKQSDIQPLVNVIGFDVDEEGEQQLKEVAESADGIFSYVENQEDLTEQFDRADEIAAQWINWRDKEIERIQSAKEDRKQEIEQTELLWEEKIAREDKNIQQAIEYLESEGIIDSSVADSLSYELSNRTLWLEVLKDDIILDTDLKNADEASDSKSEVFDAFHDNAWD
ncbi:VWA domain-containing protein [Aureibacillus halotolerans]|uniref:Ca-activated chloride channel family protein n=1 Tax=Aureibacillus halotolerans TaxID=1508390 RepID=A0A4R6UAY4_9BACI|nr:VWA domain-containing protein [Aureibacillus halotolerans]TDQ43036.1 Ca-activated chloride channel family protein [Aureibacillus halotolerans]